MHNRKAGSSTEVQKRWNIEIDSSVVAEVLTIPDSIIWATCVMPPGYHGFNLLAGLLLIPGMIVNISLMQERSEL
jgi:hypothetical protein